MKLVSVVVPTFENDQFIVETLNTIINQSYKNLEIIISDHSSNDETFSKIQEFSSDPRVTIYKFPRGGGARANWNFVSKKAKGHYVRLVCADDPLELTSIEEHVNAFMQNPEIGIVASQRKVIAADGKTLFARRGLGNLSGVIEGKKVIRACVLSGTNLLGEPSSVTFRLQNLKDVGYWAEEEYLLDLATYFKILETQKLFAIRKVLSSFRVSNVQWSFRLASKQSQQFTDYIYEIPRSFPGLLSKTDLVIGSSKAKLLARLRKLIYVIQR